MSPMTEGENALLNLAPGSCSDSPMSLGSPAISSSLALALKVRAWPATPALFGARRESSKESSNEEEMDAADDSTKDRTD